MCPQWLDGYCLYCALVASFPITNTLSSYPITNSSLTRNPYTENIPQLRGIDHLYYTPYLKLEY